MDEKILFKAGVQAGKEFLISEDEITIGRELENNIVLEDVQVSRNHARIFHKNDQLFIEDLGSTNGTVLNGKELKKAQKLKNGDMVTLGENNVLEIQIPTAQAKEEIAGKSKADAQEKDESVEKSDKRKALKLRKKEKRPKEVEELIESAQVESEDKGAVQSITDKYPTWAIVLMIAIAFIIIFCLIPWIIIEVTDQWCNLFSDFFNAIDPGVCP